MQAYIKPDIRDEHPKNKKNNKNRRNSFKIVDDNEANDDVKSYNPIQTLKSVFPNLDMVIIADTYRGLKNFDKAFEALLKMSEEASPPPVKQEKITPSIKSTPEGTPSFGTPCHEGEAYDLFKEHDKLHEEVMMILESAFNRKDMTEQQLDELIKICEENIYNLIDQEEQENQELFEIDSLSPEKVRMSSDFPSLNKANWDADSYTSSSKYGRMIDNEFKNSVKKIQPDSLNEWKNIRSKPGAAREIIKLRDQFPDLDRETIRKVYRQLNQNYESSLKYMLANYKDEHQNSPQTKANIANKMKRNISGNQNQQKALKIDKSIREILDEYTYAEMRQVVQRLKRIKCVLDRTAAQARSSIKNNKHGQIYSIENASKSQTAELDKFSEASKVYLLEQARKNKEFYQIDLHGLFWEEAKEVVTEQINYLGTEIPGNQRQYKFTKKNKKGVDHIEYAIITGKGNNSKGGIPILFNNLCDFLKRNGFSFEPRISEGRVLVYISLSNFIPLCD